MRLEFADQHNRNGICELRCSGQVSTLWGVDVEAFCVSFANLRGNMRYGDVARYAILPLAIASYPHSGSG